MTADLVRGTAHPYYASDGCYYASGPDFPHEEFGSWAEFIEENGNLDLDLNLLYRWDWRLPDPSYYEPGDPDTTQEYLELFYMQQRRALPMSKRIKVTAEQEQVISQWLRVRAAHMRLLWEPLLSTVDSGGAA